MSTYTEEKKQEAIAAYLELGQNEAGRTLGIPGPTVGRWAKRAGVVSVRPENVEAAIQARMAQVKENLSEIALAATEAVLEAIEEHGVDVKCRDAVGAWTRAIHDYQLLTGQATERVGEGDATQQMFQTLDQLKARKDKKEAEAA